MSLNKMLEHADMDAVICAKAVTVQVVPPTPDPPARVLMMVPPTPDAAFNELTLLSNLREGEWGSET